MEKEESSGCASGFSGVDDDPIASDDDTASGECLLHGGTMEESMCLDFPCYLLLVAKLEHDSCAQFAEQCPFLVILRWALSHVHVII